MDFPFEAVTFDMVITRYALHHFPAITQTFQEVYRVLRQKGCFFLCDQHPMKMMKNDLSMLICR
ncbi:class I SAM-dependent methyltransferase [[Clostridium] innocuum]|nr:class I SAM-dependent methyltransferase [[Clostridium] innocuum]MCI3000778.1 class I SAM-dependent methyltransferase [[Clostridium] innocuum]MCR0121695.1 class I SAM-dependent methyltransferase [[Clostridium] innocuum]MCR0177417.1 class I SAM-dependent methyltransferase [[Clostridium] innocuum]MCR0208761.1 class I SAM-dependent methyltransferase [[Clostridium] innocuum]MCR0240030.1 class I SAM-dependent methyltransferase [[Clostridium] innocuum]